MRICPLGHDLAPQLGQTDSFGFLGLLQLVQNAILGFGCTLLPLPAYFDGTVCNFQHVHLFAYGLLLYSETVSGCAALAGQLPAIRHLLLNYRLLHVV